MNELCDASELRQAKEAFTLKHRRKLKASMFLSWDNAPVHTDKVVVTISDNSSFDLLSLSQFITKLCPSRTISVS